MYSLGYQGLHVSWVLSALPVQFPMPGCLPLIAAILMQKFPGKQSCLKSSSEAPHDKLHLAKKSQGYFSEGTTPSKTEIQIFETQSRF